MIDYATQERQALIADLSADIPLRNRALKVSWPIPKEPITEPLNPSVDAEYQSRADQAWALVRSRGKVKEWIELRPSHLGTISTDWLRVEAYSL